MSVRNILTSKQSNIGRMTFKFKHDISKLSRIFHAIYMDLHFLVLVCFFVYFFSDVSYYFISILSEPDFTESCLPSGCSEFEAI